MTISRPLLALAAALLIPQTLPAQACLAAPRTATGWIGARVARTSDHENLFGADAGRGIELDLVRRAAGGVPPGDAEGIPRHLRPVLDGRRVGVQPGKGIRRSRRRMVAVGEP